MQKNVWLHCFKNKKLVLCFNNLKVYDRRDTWKSLTWEFVCLVIGSTLVSDSSHFTHRLTDILCFNLFCKGINIWSITSARCWGVTLQTQLKTFCLVSLDVHFPMFFVWIFAIKTNSKIAVTVYCIHATKILSVGNVVMYYSHKYR